jgi:hypothetical protein
MSSNIGKPTLIPSSVVQIEKHGGADLLSKNYKKEERTPNYSFAFKLACFILKNIFQYK